MAAPRRRRRPQRYHHGNLKPVLLQVAMDVLETEGIEKLTLRRITELAGVSHSAPYNHFPTRQSLLIALATEGFHRLLAHQQTVMESSASGGNPGERILALGRSYFLFAKDHPNLFDLMFSHHVSPVSKHPELYRVSSETFGTLTTAIDEFADQFPDSSLKPIEKSTAAFAAWALSHGVTTLVLSQAIEMERATADSPRQLMDQLNSFLFAALTLSLSAPPQDSP